MYRLRIQDLFGNKRLNELKRQELQVFHADLLTQGLSPATADHHLKLIRQVLNKALEFDVLSINPIGKVKLFNVDNRRENYLTPTQLEALLKVLQEDENQTVCLVARFLLSTGARLNEALGATWDKIDLPNRVWRIPASNSKSKRGRSVPVSDSAVRVLEQLDTKEQGQYLFVSPKTKARLKNVHKVWDRLRIKAGLPTLTLHSLRHNFASFLVNSGRTLYETQKILGHSSHSVTERYSHLSSKTLMDAANSASLVIEGAMGGPSQKAAA